MGAPQCRCCCENDEGPMPYPLAQKPDSFAEEMVTGKNVTLPLVMGQEPSEPSEPRPRKDSSPRRLRTSSDFSTRTSKSSASGGTARPGEAAQMIFEMEQGKHWYDEDQLREIATLQPNGSVVITGVLGPFAVTVDGHPGVLPGDTIQQVIGSTYDLNADILRRLEYALRCGGRVTLLVETRPMDFDVDIYCDGENWFRLGLLVTIDRLHADRIKIQGIYENGLLPSWNRKNPFCQVMPGDWIVHVNGEARSAQEMAKDIHDCQEGDDLWLGIQTRPRITVRAEGESTKSLKINPKSQELNPRSQRKLPKVERFKTLDWKQMQQTLAKIPAEGGGDRSLPLSQNSGVDRQDSEFSHVSEFSNG